METVPLRKRILDTIVRKSSLKQKVFDNTFWAFNLLKEFESYARREDADIARDGSMFVALPIFATAEELERMAAGIRDVIRPHLSRTSDEQRMHTFAAVVTPPTQEGEDAL